MNIITPVFRIFDVTKAKEFYIDWLGFTQDWEHRFGENFPLYMSVSKEAITIHLSEHHGDACPGSKIMINYPNLQEYCNLLNAKDYRYFKPSIYEAHWGSYIMEVTDPFGNKIMFSEPKTT